MTNGSAWRRPAVLVAVLSVLLAVGSAAAQLPLLAAALPISGRAAVGLAVLASLFALADRFVVTFPVRRGAHTLSLCEIPMVLGLTLVAPGMLTIARLVGGLVGLVVVRRQRGAKLAFNLALYLTQVTVAGVVFHLVRGGHDPLSPIGWAGAFAATFAADLVSIVAISAVIAIHDDSQEWHRLLSADIRKLFQLPLVAVTTALGLIIAVVVREQVIAAVLLGVLALAMHRVFQRYAQQTQGHAQVEALYRFTRALGGSPDADAVARVVLGQVRDQIRAESAELLVVTGATTTRMRLDGRDTVTTGEAGPIADEWWRPALDGEPILLAGKPDDAIAVPVAMDDATGVLLVTGSLPDVPTFTAEHMRLLEALGAHAGVALTNARLVDRLRHLGMHDALTDLPNRNRLLADLRRAIGEMPRTTGVIGVLLLDLDRFKEINDALGHVVGDGVLREVGSRLRRRFGSRATVTRLGGDEFALVVPGVATTDELLVLAHDVLATVAESIEVGGLALTTSASIGVCFAPDHGTDPDRLLQRADVAMYAAKHARSGVRVYRAEDDQNTPRRLALMAELRTDIERGSLDVVYQPKVDPRTGRVVGAEALSRWHSADGPVPPDEFIPLAERSGLIRPLTAHVLDTALAACASWRRAGHDLTVAVNLSPQMVADHTLVEDVRELLRRYGLPPAALTLEITETGVMADPTHSLITLNALNTLGVKLSVDDFGTGHSSLGRLAELPIHEVKIDKGFVHDLTEQPGRRAVTDAALHLGRALGLVVVAEGVETATELDYLREHGCGVVQGYFISRPAPADEFRSWLADRSGWAEDAEAPPAHQLTAAAG